MIAATMVSHSVTLRVLERGLPPRRVSKAAKRCRISSMRSRPMLAHICAASSLSDSGSRSAGLSQ